jgi:hypothetical protein
MRQVASATELFGPRTGGPEQRKRSRRLYRNLAAALHPDRVGTDDTAACGAAADLSRLYQQWEHGTDDAVELWTPAGARYRIGVLSRVGTIANTYLAERADGTPHVVKVVRNPAMNPLLHAEWDAMRTLAALTTEHRWLAPHYPRMVDNSGPVNRDERAATVFAPLADGFVSMADIHAAFPDGLDGRDYAWMHRRLLRAVAGAHRAGIVHGAIVPTNVLVHPAEHGVVLADWSFAVEPGQRLLATSRSPEFRSAYPPEVRAGSAVTPATDVHMCHALMLHMLADGETRQRTFASGCLQERPGARPDAVDLLDEYDALLDEEYGRRRFRPFAMPTEQDGA